MPLCLSVKFSPLTGVISNLASAFSILAELEICKSSYAVGSFANFFPAVWYQSFEGGNIWVTTLGHDKNNYQEPTFKNHLLQGIKFIANQYKGINYSKAVAMDKDAPLKN